MAEVGPRSGEVCQRCQQAGRAGESHFRDRLQVPNPTEGTGSEGCVPRLQERSKTTARWLSCGDHRNMGFRPGPRRMVGDPPSHEHCREEIEGKVSTARPTAIIAAAKKRW